MIQLSYMAIPSVSSNKVSPLRSEQIVDMVADFFGVRYEEFTSKTRTRELVFIRNCCIYLLRKYAEETFRSAGQIMGGRDHTTAIYAVQTLRNDYDTNEAVRNTVDELEGRIMKATHVSDKFKRQRSRNPFAQSL